MPVYNALRDYFWNIDPGYFNLKQAAKTILAILISLWLVRDQSQLTLLLAGLASGISMQGVVAKTWRTRIFHVVVFDLAYFGVFALGLIVRDSADATAVTLILLAFVVNYIRRFGLTNSSAPMKVWVLCFLATILPLQSTDLWASMNGLLVGFAVSAFVILFVYPNNYPRLFINNSNRFFSTLSKGLNEFRSHLQSKSPIKDFAHSPFLQIKKTLSHLVDTNQAVQQSTVFTKNGEQVNLLLVHQYALLNVYGLMVEAYHTLWQHEDKLPRSIRLALSLECKQFAKLFAGMCVKSDFLLETDFSLGSNLNLREKLAYNPLRDAALIMALLNFKLSFTLLTRYIANLLQENNET